MMPRHIFFGARGVCTILAASMGLVGGLGSRSASASDSKIYEGAQCRAFGTEVAKVVYPTTGGVSVAAAGGYLVVGYVDCDITRDYIAGVIDSVKFRYFKSWTSTYSSYCSVFSPTVYGTPFPGYDVATGIVQVPVQYEDLWYEVFVGDFTEYDHSSYYMRCNLTTETPHIPDLLRFFRVQEST